MAFKHGRKTVLTCIWVALWLMGTCHLARGQNTDLFSGKEFDDMGKLNPAFTGFLEEFRLLSGKSDQLRAGIESRFLKTPNFFGVNFEMDEIEHLKRQRFQISYAREKEYSSHFTLKYAAGVDYQLNTFFRTEKDTLFAFTDFQGNTWHYNHRVSEISVRSELADLGAGLGGVYKNLVFGLNARHIGGAVMKLYTDSSAVRIPVEWNAQLAGFIVLGPEMRLFPNIIYARSGDQSLLATGLGLTRGNWSISGQYEMLDALKRIDIAVYGRLGRWLLGLGYVHDDPPVSEDLLFIDRIRLTMNTSILRKKKTDASTFIGKMKHFY